MRAAVALLLTTVLVSSASASADQLPPVYQPQRLQTIKLSITVVGTVWIRPTRQRDGDVTFKLVSGDQRYHVVIVCVNPRAEAARAACDGYVNKIPIPRRGDHVRITGPLVRDLTHASPHSELEIHPVTALVVL